MCFIKPTVETFTRPGTPVGTVERSSLRSTTSRVFLWRIKPSSDLPGGLYRRISEAMKPGGRGSGARDRLLDSIRSLPCKDGARPAGVCFFGRALPTCCKAPPAAATDEPYPLGCSSRIRSAFLSFGPRYPAANECQQAPRSRSRLGDPRPHVPCQHGPAIRQVIEVNVAGFFLTVGWSRHRILSLVT